MKKLLIAFMLLFCGTTYAGQGYSINKYTGKWDNTGGWQQYGNDTWKVDNGNVGIGTTAPTSTLDVVGALRVSSIGTFGDTITAAGNNSQITFANGQSINGNNTNSIIISAPTTIQGNSSQLVFSNGNQINGNNTGQIYTDASLGIGIGLTSVRSILSIRGSGSGTANPLFLISDSTPTDRLVVLNNGNVGIGTTAPVGTLHVGSQSVPPLFVSAGGNVGIGTSAPGSILQVGSAPYPLLTIASSGNVGIGAYTTPNSKLEILGSSTLGFTGLRITNIADATGEDSSLVFQMSSNYGGEYGGKIGAYRMGASARSDMYFSTTTDGGVLTERMRITKDGNVGIGITATSGALDIASATYQVYTGGRSIFTNISPAFTTASGQTPNTVFNGFNNYAGILIRKIALGTGDYLIVEKSDTTSILSVKSSGNVGVGTAAPLGKVHIVGDSIAGTGFLLRLSDSTPTDRMVVLNNGNVGVGTTAPTSTLHIIGTGTGTQSVLCRTTTGQIGTCDAPATCLTCTPF